MHRRADGVDPVEPDDFVAPNNPRANVGVNAKITIVVRVVERC